MDAQKAFTDWCVSQRVAINDIAIHRFPERGFGIVAERDFEVRGVLASFPLLSHFSASPFIQLAFCLILSVYSWSYVAFTRHLCVYKTLNLTQDKCSHSYN